MTSISMLLSTNEDFYQFVPDYFGADPYMKELFSIGPSIFEQRYVSFIYTGNFFYDEAGVLRIDKCSGIPESFFYDNPEVGLIPEEQLDAEKINYLDKQIINIALVHPGISIYGHWLIDILPKIKSFQSEFPKHIPTVVTTSHAPSWALKAISVLANFDGEILLLKQGEVYHGSIYMCSPTRFHDRMSARSVSLRKIAVNSVAKEKLFIARRGKHSGRDLNNKEEFERLIVDYGFKYLYPEDMSLVEQIHAFSSAAYIIGESGSGMHNSIFAPLEARIIVVQSSRQNHFIQAGLCYLCKQDVDYFWGQSDTEDWTSSFTVDLENLSSFLNNIVQN